MAQRALCLKVADLLIPSIWATRNIDGRLATDEGSCEFVRHLRHARSPAKKPTYLFQNVRFTGYQWLRSSIKSPIDSLRLYTSKYTELWLGNILPLVAHHSSVKS